MPESTSEPPNLSSQPKFTEPNQSPSFDRWLEALGQSDQASYNMMAIEVWSIAKTMDKLAPGFWNRFMANRQLALKQFLQHKQQQRVERSKKRSNSI